MQTDFLAMAREIVYIVLGFGAALLFNVKASFFSLNAGGPLQFNLADYYFENSVLTRTKDICQVYKEQMQSTLRFGGELYGKLTVCGNGYIIIGKTGTAETADPMVNSSEFDNPKTPVIAVGLIENDRDDGLFDFDCIVKGLLPDRMNSNDETCASAARAASSYYHDLVPIATLQNINHNLNPKHGLWADNAIKIQQWLASINPINYASFVENSGAYGDELKTSIFSGPLDNATNFEPTMANNVITRLLKATERTMLKNLIGDEEFINEFAYCISWYKVGQPPEIIDHHNTYQLVLACSRNAAFTLTQKCVVLFDYFELGYTEQNGQVMRAGATGPGLSKCLD